MIDLRLGDCLEVLKEIPSESIDLVVTSPPYDNLRTYNGSNDWSHEKFKAIAQELARSLVPGGTIVWIVGDATIKGSETGSSFRQALYFKDECGLNLHDTMIYEKDGCPFPESNRYYPIFEFMFILTKGRPKTTNLIADRKNKQAGDKVTGKARQPNGELLPHIAIKNKTGRVIKDFGVRHNIWKTLCGRGKSTLDFYAHEHPAIFPEKLAGDHILSWSNPGDTILDPFLGSGTTGKMAILNGRKFIGIEREPSYFELAQKRIKQYEPEAI